jgi:hypothetical protein
MTATATKRGPRIVNFAKGEQVVTPVALADITTSHNPRRPCPTLQDHLTEKLGGMTLLEFCHEYALGDEAQRQTFVELIEGHESYTKGIVELAASRRIRQIEPILLRNFRVKAKAGSEAEGEYITRQGVICGERRVIAAFYNHAKHGDPANIGAVSIKCTVEEAEDYAFAENDQRKEMTETEVGHFFRRKCERRKQERVDALAVREQAGETLTKDDKKPYTLKDLAFDLNYDYQYVRTREALTYLTVDEQRQVDRKEINLTDAWHKGLKVKNRKGLGEADDEGPSGKAVKKRKKNRRRVETLKEVEARFDASPKDNKEYRRALADVMGIELAVAEKESKARLEALEAKEVSQAARADKGYRQAHAS